MSPRSGSVDGARADEVVLDGQQERLVPRELEELVLGFLVQLPIQRDFDDEVRHVARFRERCHAEEDPPGLRVLRDRLERTHVRQTAPAGPGIRQVFGRLA